MGSYVEEGCVRKGMWRNEVWGRVCGGIGKGI